MRKLLTLILAFMATTATLFASSGSCGENVNWELTGGVLTISGTGPMDDFGYNAAPWFSEHSSITSAIIENGITSIGEGAFSRCENLLSVTIPNSVTSIHGAAFTVCTSLLSVTIPENVETIGTYAFNDCKALTEITIPENVTSIGECAFQRCYGLTEITCKAVIPPTLNDDVFSGVDKSIPVYVPSGAQSAYKAADGWSDFTNIQGISGGGIAWSLKDGVLTISGTGEIDNYDTYHGFFAPWYSERDAVTSLIIENGITRIGAGAFYDCTALTEITCEATTPPTVGSKAFYNVNTSIPVKVPDASVSAYQAAAGWSDFTNIQGISGGGGVTWDLTGGVLTISGTGPMTEFASDSEVPWKSQLSSITTVIIEDGVTSIGNYAFYNCKNLSSVTMPSSVTTIGVAAFRTCKSLTSVTIPNGVASIGDNAFRECGLISFTFPSSVTSVGYRVLASSYNLVNITCEATTPPTCTSDAFTLNKSVPLYVPAESVEAYSSATGWSVFTSIQAISSGSSGSCGENVTWDLTGGVLTISGTGAMTDFTFGNTPWQSELPSITTVIIEDGVTHIGDCAFDDYSSALTSVTIPNSITSIGHGAFAFCQTLTSVAIPNSVMTIGDGAFEAAGITTLTIGDGLTEIGYRAFYNCIALTEITCKATTPPTCGTEAFSLVDKSIPVYVPEEAVSAYQAADEWYQFENIQKIPTGHGTCGENAKWILVDKVLTISGTGTMTNYIQASQTPWYDERNAITSVIVEEGITHIGNFAFRLCKPMRSATIPSSVTSIGDNAFSECTALNKITCEATTPPTLGEDVFKGVDKSIPVYVPSVAAYQAAADWSDFTNILCGGSCGENVNWLLKDGVLTISGTGSMDDYSGKAVIPWYAERKSIVSVIIEDGVTSIGKHAFNECINIASVQIAQTITGIGNYAFRRCDALTSLTIPAAVKSIGKQAFLDCSGLTEITCEAVIPPTLKEEVFSGVDASIPVYVPVASVSAYQAADGWSDFTNIQAIKLTPEEQKQVDVVVDLINAIYDAPITLESEPAIVAAREAYNALSEAQQAAVYNYESLVEAEATLAALKANIPIITDGWVHYDNGVFYSSFKLGGNESWGICIPANTVEEKALTMVSMYAYVAGEYTVEVYNGGATPAEGKKLSSQLVNLPTAGDFNIATLAEPVPVDPTQDIWVIFCNTAGLKGPMSACAKMGATNGSWYFIPDDGWYAFGDIAWMIRAFFETYTGEAWIDGINYFLDGSDLTAQVLDLSGDKYVGDIVVPEKVTYINDYTVTSINSEAFTNSPELLSVSLPKTVNWIEPGSFLRNPKLTAINVAPANTTYSSLDGVLFNTVQTELIAYPTGRAGAYVVPEGVETILDEAFTDNANLTAITLPASLIEIASLAFDECTGLTSITSKAVNAPAAGSDAFHKVNKSIPVYVPQKGLASYKAEYEWKDFTNFITIEDQAAADAVIVKIEAIGAVAYTTECKDRIDAARNAYDALTADQKGLVPAEKLAILTAAEKAYDDLKKQAEADQAAADIVIGQINAIGEVSLSSEPAIVAARAAYNALTDAQKALVSNYAVLTAAEVKLEILKKQAESDAAAAAAVTDLINGIGTVTYTTDCKERIDAAREAYNALTDAQKALVTNLGTLTAAEKAYADLKAKAEADQAAADIVIGKINAIGAVSYSEASKALIDDARAAYNALTDAQKGLIPAATYKVLTDAEQAYADLKAKAAADLAAANIVITKINAIGSVTLSSEPAIVDARAAYNALTTDQKALVTNYATLVAAEKALADLKAKAAADQAAADNVIAEINAIGTVTLSSEPAIVAARAAYNALTADQKALVTNLSTLTAAEVKLAQLKEQAAADQAAADLVIGKINAIGTVSYSEASKALIDAARTAYDALTAAQQALVTNLGTLTAAEKAYADLKAKAEADQAAANTVIGQINAIGEVTLASEPAIVAARAAYNALTADQKALVSNYNVLTAAEAKLEVLKKQAESDEAAAAAVSNLISGIGSVSYTTECKARIDAAREAYDALTDAQKALVTNLATLTAAEKAYADLKAKAEADQAAANTVIAQINAIGEVTLASEPAIVAARSAYNALTADQKALVSNYSVLTAAEAKLEVLKQQAEADQAAATAVIGKINAIGVVSYSEASKALIDDARHAYDALTAAQKALVTNLDILLAAEQAYADLKAQAEAVAAAKQQLVDLVSEAAALKAVAAMYAPSAVGEIEAIIASAQATINDPNATLEEINTKYENLQYDFELEANKLLEEAKEQLRQSLKSLYLPGDYPSWYASVIIPALDQVDAMAWDFSMTVQENILLFQATGQTLYNNAKKALEDLRANDTRELVSSCTFTGFADAIQLDMTWNKSALNNLVNTLNASAATEPYHLEADGCMLGKWDPVEEQMVEVMGEKITEGQYQFVAYVTINGEEAKTYRFPKATEAVLTVTVDGTPWTVDLSGITIDANYSHTYIASPRFEISKSEDVELIEIEPVKTQKIYHNGHFYILRGEHIYDIRGTLVR